MAIHKISPVFPLKFLWLTFLEDVSHGIFGPRQHKIPGEIKYMFVFGTWQHKIPEEIKYVCLWHMALAFDNQKRQIEKNGKERIGRGKSLNIYGFVNRLFLV